MSAACEHRFEVGEIVYLPYRTQRYGKVIANLVEQDDAGKLTLCLVRWKDGIEEKVWDVHLNSLNQLLAETEKKAESHRVTIAKAQQL